MIMLIFLFFIVAGLGLFGFVFMKELKSGALDSDSPLAAAVPSVEKPVQVESPQLKTLIARSASGLPENPEDPAAAAGGILGERILKLEQLLEEKNSHIAQIERALAAECSHREEFEKVKDLLQRQIEELKAQNKVLKDDLERELQKNIPHPDQVKVTETVPVKPVLMEEKIVSLFDEKKDDAEQLTLYDILEKDKNKDKPV